MVKNEEFFNFSFKFGFLRSFEVFFEVLKPENEVGCLVGKSLIIELFAVNRFN